MKENTKIERPTEQSARKVQIPKALSDIKLHDELDIWSLFRQLYRRKFIIISILIVMMTVVSIRLYTAVPLYTARALLTLSFQIYSVPKFEEVYAGVGKDEWSINTELDIIRSSSIIERVAASLKLYDDPEFNPDMRKAKPKDEDKEKGFHELDPVENAMMVKRRLLGKLRTNLKAEHIQDSNSITISYTSPNPVKAARIVNAIADIYLQDQLEAKYAATKQTNEWLTSRLEELRNEVKESEIKEKQVREEGDLFKARGVTILEQQIADVNTQLIEARIKKSRAEARLARIKDVMNSPGGEETLIDIIDSDSIKQLRDDATTLGRKRSELRLRYGPKHPNMLKIEAEIQEVQNKIKQEAGRIVKSLENEVQLARAEERSLNNSLNQLRKEAGQAMKAEFKLRDIERPAQSAKELYNEFFTRLQEMRSQDELQRPDARIISRADIPQAPSYPRTRMTLFLGLAAGLFLGIIAAFLREIFDRGFRTAEHIERLTGVSVLGNFPTLEKGQNTPVEYVIEKPYSAMAESLRSFQTALQLSNVDKPPKTVMVTSTLPVEGKSSFTASWGSVSALSGRKTIVVDTDLRRPILAKQFPNIKTEIRLEDLLIEHRKEQRNKLIKKAIVKDPRSGLYLLMAHGKSSAGPDILNSESMQQILRLLKRNFDMVILDAPPFMGVSDVWTLAKSIDALIFMVRWGTTPRDTVQSALRQMELMEIKPNGIVMSLVDVKKQAYYGHGGYGYYYKRYKKYYND